MVVRSMTLLPIKYIRNTSVNRPEAKERIMPTYTYDCFWCKRTRTVTRLNDKENCCGSQMKLVKTYPPRIYENKKDVTYPMNKYIKN